MLYFTARSNCLTLGGSAIKSYLADIFIDRRGQRPEFPDAVVQPSQDVEAELFEVTAAPGPLFPVIRLRTTQRARSGDAFTNGNSQPRSLAFFASKPAVEHHGTDCSCFRATGDGAITRAIYSGPCHPDAWATPGRAWGELLTISQFVVGLVLRGEAAPT